jgi:predicted enzyme related to lactoylglutathione lyase
MPPQVPKDAQQMGAGHTVYFFVASIEEASYLSAQAALADERQATARIEAAGGKTVLPKMEQGKGNFFSNLIDIEGNRFGIYQVSEENM